ncbi:divalent-cation tolerance protein CutA [Qipengyuania intermedia]|uniref:divalent-cation tolerance protein CutA n=1 Tax=Qipengyuania intermedia TaxID=2867244 RepID=UPI0031F18C95
MTALIYCPFPDEEGAREAGRVLLDEELIGCINIGPAIQSLFSWAGERGEEKEIPALIKTDAILLDRAIARLEDLHPYDSPAILGWPCVGGSATTDWLRQLGSGPDE